MYFQAVHRKPVNSFDSPENPPIHLGKPEILSCLSDNLSEVSTKSRAFSNNGYSFDIRKSCCNKWISLVSGSPLNGGTTVAIYYCMGIGVLINTSMDNVGTKQTASRHTVTSHLRDFEIAELNCLYFGRYE